MTIPEPVLRELRDIVGPAGYLDQPDEMEPYLADHRRLYRGATPLVLRPDSTEQVAAILALCNEHRIGVVPQGGNTGYCGGATPSADGSQLVLSLSRMKRIRALDALDYSMVAEAGCVLAQVRAAAEAADRLFPLNLGSAGSCQIGGNLSTNAGGTAVLRYGVMRELVLGVEVVLADGRVLDLLAPLRKNNAGYDLRDVFIGAEGTLGVITAASLKLFPRPRTVETALAALPGTEAAIELLARLRDASGDLVTSFELLPRVAVELALIHVPGTADPFDRPYPAYALIELASARIDPELRQVLERTLAQALEAGRVLDAALAASLAQREAFWRLRESIPEAQGRAGASLKHDVSVPVGALARFEREATAVALAICPGARIVSYGHVGDGSLHFNLSPSASLSAQALLAREEQVRRAVHDLVARYRGSFSAEHGIGQLKRDELARYADPVRLALMRSLKQALDPNGIMNPGKVL